MILDIDHISKKNLTPNHIKKQILSNSFIMAAFTSPSNEGIKILFKLQPKITDIALYKNFYKLFALKFAQQYQYEELIDLKTCDATRATFLSYDPEIYINTQYQVVNFNDFININNTLEIDLMLKEINTYEKKHPSSFPPVQTTLTDEILLNIKQKLNPQYKPPQKLPYVPEKLNEILPSIIIELEQQGLHIESVENIQYGKKIKISLQQRWAE
jgi:VirE N-terminal domain.